jgi:hypothetical protein
VIVGAFLSPSVSVAATLTFSPGHVMPQGGRDARRAGSARIGSD